MKLKYNIQARTNVTQDAYYAIEKINLLLKDYTIDYEEYFNRKNVGCDNDTTPFERNVWENGYCDLFTAYGNNNALAWTPFDQRNIYFCSSTNPWETSPYVVLNNPGIQNGEWCLNTGKQSFGQYYRQFRDVKNDVDDIGWAWNDDDDENVMKWPDAIEDSENTKELYLISQDGTSRVLIRRHLVESGDWNGDAVISGDSEKLYTLQILKLRGFDAGNNHDFNINNASGVYDGKIDTRACDYAQGFICNGSGIGTIYANYKIPADKDDGRVDLFQKNITISNWNITISPTKNPQYALAENEVQINPYFTLQLTSKLYGKIRQKKLGMQTIDNFQVSLQTTFNTKNFYTK